MQQDGLWPGAALTHLVEPHKDVGELDPVGQRQRETLP